MKPTMTGHEKIRIYLPRCVKAAKEMLKKVRELVSQGKIPQKEVEEDEERLTYMMSLTEDNYYDLFDDAIIYTIAESYVRMTVSELIEEKVLNWGQSEAVVQRLKGHFETIGGSKEVCEKY